MKRGLLLNLKVAHPVQYWVRIKAPMKRGLLHSAREAHERASLRQNKGPDEEGIVTLSGPPDVSEGTGSE